ncbi:MAG: LytTR family DNA-binding domain-containing protein [Pseudomonadota bacterium]
MTDTIRAWIRGTVIVVVLAALFTWLGVYERGDTPALLRFGMWLIFLAVGVIASIGVTPQVFHERFERIGAGGQIMVASAIIAIPVWIALLILEAVLLGPPPMQSWAIQYIYVFVISVVITIGGWFLRRHDETKELYGDKDQESLDPCAAFLERLPIKYRSAALHAVASEDHYLRVHTSLGEELILMRLADAIRELGGADGLQVHRSWWVAAPGVEAVRKQGDKVILVLKSGAEVPVSRTYAKAVREAGWL